MGHQIKNNEHCVKPLLALLNKSRCVQRATKIEFCQLAFDPVSANQRKLHVRGNEFQKRMGPSEVSGNEQTGSQGRLRFPSPNRLGVEIKTPRGLGR